MLKLLMSITVCSSFVVGSDSTELDQKITTFLQKSITPNENYAFEKVSILKKEAMKESPSWMVYFVKVDLNLLKQEGKKISVNDLIFTDGKMISKDFSDLSTGRSVKNNYALDMDTKAYNKEHLLAGSMNAPHKIVVFSDPLCPFCMDLLPEVIDDVKKNPDTFALFYYHFPLNMHPAAPTLVKAMLLAEEKGDKEIVKKVYKEFFDIKESDEKVVLDIFNKAFNTHFSVEQINQEKIIQKLTADYEFATTMMVNGTPTVYLDGKRDDSKRTYRKFIKESK